MENGNIVHGHHDNGTTTTVRGLTIYNRSVVPYNSYLTKQYNAHINVEICSTVKLQVHIAIHLQGI